VQLLAHIYYPFFGSVGMANGGEKEIASKRIGLMGANSRKVT
jgi:hypothetical protein